MNGFRSKKSKILILCHFLNQLFEQLNVSVKLVDVVVWQDKNEIELSWSAKETVQSFKKYRTDVLAVNQPSVNAHLVTAQEFVDAFGVYFSINRIRYKTKY